MIKPVFVYKSETCTFNWITTAAAAYYNIIIIYAHSCVLDV